MSTRHSSRPATCFNVWSGGRWKVSGGTRTTRDSGRDGLIRCVTYRVLILIPISEICSGKLVILIRKIKELNIQAYDHDLVCSSQARQTDWLYADDSSKCGHRWPTLLVFKKVTSQLTEFWRRRTDLYFVTITTFEFRSACR